MMQLLPIGSKNKPTYTRKWEWAGILVSSYQRFHPESAKGKHLIIQRSDRMMMMDDGIYDQERIVSMAYYCTSSQMAAAIYPAG